LCKKDTLLKRGATVLSVLFTRLSQLLLDYEEYLKKKVTYLRIKKKATYFLGGYCLGGSETKQTNVIYM